MYSLKAIVLEGCPYCNKLKVLLNSNNINTEYITIPWNEKYKYKTEKISTFPQVYMVKNGEPDILIGGYSNVKTIINLIKEKDFDTIKKKISSKYYFTSNKNKLRLIELFTLVKS